MAVTQALLDRLPWDTPCKFSSPPTPPHIRHPDMTCNRKGLDSFIVGQAHWNTLGNLNQVHMASKAPARVPNWDLGKAAMSTNQSHLQLPCSAHPLVLPACLRLQSRHFLTNYYSCNTLGQLYQKQWPHPAIETSTAYCDFHLLHSTRAATDTYTKLKIYSTEPPLFFLISAVNVLMKSILLWQRMKTSEF